MEWAEVLHPVPVLLLLGLLLVLDLIAGGGVDDRDLRLHVMSRTRKSVARYLAPRLRIPAPARQRIEAAAAAEVEAVAAHAEGDAAGVAAGEAEHANAGGVSYPASRVTWKISRMEWS